MNFLREAFCSALSMIISGDPEVFFIVLTSLKVSAAATAASAVTGIPLGMALAVNRFKGKRLLLLVLNTSMAIPTVVIGLFFYILFSRSGPLGSLGLLFTPSGMIVGLYALSLPLIVNMSVLAVQALDSRFFLTAKLLGANYRQQGWLILREARFALMGAVVVGFGRVVSEVGIAMMLGGNIKGFTRTMTTAIALETSKGELELSMALGIILIVVSLGVNVLLYVIQEYKR
uniref:ABC transporter permease subunit n=1 Tax=Desulfomonile tiedjei TaxID=2358 RepID=A0A7C4ASQ7_9BACT